MRDQRDPTTLSLSESVLAWIDELMAQAGSQSRGGLIDSLLREVLFDNEEPQESQPL
jgi:metal-responsive CopG/Arc/MetJ family transcriptional regulator